MDRMINIKVGGNHLSKDNKNAGVKGEANVTNLRITFDESWKGYAKTVTFWDAYGNNPVKRIESTDLLEDITKDTLTYITPIPKEPLAIAGEMTFVIDGYKDGKRMRSISDTLVVKDAPETDNAGEPTDPTPTPDEQLQKEIDGIIDTIQNAVIAEQNAKISETNAEAYKNLAQMYADMTEEDSVKATLAVGRMPYIGENGNWFAWDGHNETFYDTGVRAQSGSEVYYGDNPPEEADVWIDPNGEESEQVAYKSDIPAKTSDLENDSDFTTKAYVDEVVPAKTSQLTNDSDFTTKSYVDDAVPKYTWDDIMSVLFESLPTKVSQLDNDSGYINDITLYDSINSALSGYVKDENYVHTDNNFTDAVSEFCWDMIGIFGGNAFSVASQNYVKSYVDEKLGVIENGSY